jgi:hypothetical protein
MKIRIPFAALALAALALAAPASAQERPKLGLGVAFFPVTPGFGATVEVYAPFQVGPNFRLEPSLGIYTNNDGVDTRDITLGVGAFLQKRVAPAVDMYAGGRLKLNLAKASVPGASESGTDVLIAAAAGGEYFLAPKFSLGLEGNLGMYQNNTISGDDSGFFTTGLAFLRVYFK